MDEDREDTGKVVPGAGTLDILYEDEAVIVLNKPGSIPCHQGRYRKGSARGRNTGYSL